MTAALLELPDVQTASQVARRESKTGGSTRESMPLSEVVCPGRLVELSGCRDTKIGSARTSAAVRVLLETQKVGETAVWIQPRGGSLYPPDLAECGIDLDALLVVHIPVPTCARPAREHPHALCKAAELLLRSGGFGLVVLDFTDGAPPAGRNAWQGRLLGLARQHHTQLLVLTEKPAHADSLGTLVGVRIEPRRYREPRRGIRGVGNFTLEHAVLKNKSGASLRIEQDTHRGPWGMR